MSQTSGSFNGVFTLKTKENAMQLSEAVRRIVEKAVNIFYIISADPGAKKDLIMDLELICRLLPEFPDICIDDEGKQAGLKSIRNIEASKAKIVRALNEHTPRSGLNQQQTECVGGETRNILLELATIAELMESQQQKRLMKIVKTGLDHLIIMRDTKSDYRFSSKAKSAIDDLNNVITAMKRRAEVVEDDLMRGRIENAVNIIQVHSSELIGTTREVISNPNSSESIRAQADVIKSMATAFKELMEVINSTMVKSSASFDFDAITDSLTALQNAVRSGSTRAAVDAAREVAQEIATLRDKAHSNDSDSADALANSCDALYAMTAKLVAATKDALNSGTGDGLDRVVSEMKSEVNKASELSGKQRNLRDELRECAEKLSIEMGGMVDDMRR